MSLFKVFAVAGSGMSAQALRLNVTASNLANADSISGSEGKAYRAREPVFAALVDSFSAEEAAGGVQVLGVVESQAPLRKEYQPGHPLADTEGYVYRPNVDAVEEMANMISAARSYETDVEVINTSKQLLLRTLQLGE